jgi:hypothetical protein
MKCIHIQTHLPHFEYTNQLILSFLTQTNIKTLSLPIYIVLDDIDSISTYKKKYSYEYNLVFFLNTKEIISNSNLEYKEVKLFSSKIDAEWGAGGNRNYIAVKRTYSLLHLKSIGFDFVWCLDCESLILKPTNIEPILKANVKKPLLTIGKNSNGIKYPQIIEKVFKLTFNDYKDISVRMNDFWFVHTKYFASMIELLFSLHKQPISYFVIGCEQSLYEYYLYGLYLKNSDEIDVIFIDGDLHANNLFNSIINSDANLEKFCIFMNSKYFDFVQSYRGDYYKDCLTSSRGKQLISNLNINIAVSNYQGT